MKPNNETIAHELAIEYLRISATEKGAGSIDGFATRYCQLRDRAKSALDAYDDAHPIDFGSLN